MLTPLTKHLSKVHVSRSGGGREQKKEEDLASTHQKEKKELVKKDTF